MAINTCLQLLVDLLLLLQLLLSDRSQVGELADINLVGHVLCIALSQHAHSVKQLVIDGDLVFKGTAISGVQYINFLSLVFQVDLEVHGPVDGLLDTLPLLRDLLNLFLLIL